MSNFIFILSNNILPIFFQIAMGTVAKKTLNINIDTISKIQFYILIPALLFVKMYDSKLDLTVFLGIATHTIILFALLYIISLVVSKLMKYNRSSTVALTNSICIYNSGNYCIPLIQLLYNSPLALSIQFQIMMIQNILTNTFGVFNSSSANKNSNQAFINIFKVPMLYSVIVAFLFKYMNIEVWHPLLVTLDSLGNGLVPLALLTLGAQLAETKFSIRIPKVYISIFFRLIISPIVAYLIVILLGLKGIIAEVAIISSAAPTAVNAMILAIEYENEPEFTSQAIFLSTLVSAITVSIVIFLVKR